MTAPAPVFAPTAPVWLLDVDGVLNTSRPGWGSTPDRANILSGARYYKVRWSPLAIAEIRALHLSGRVEVRWATTWCPDADKLELHMRLPALARTLTAADVDTAEATNAAKQAVALSVVEDEGRPLVWTDDEAIPYADEEFMTRLRSAGPPVHLLSPANNRGLRPEHVQAITAFAHACANTA